MERTKLLTYAVIGLLVLNLVTIGILLVKPGQDDDSAHPPGGRGASEPAQVIIDRLHLDRQQQQQYQKMVMEHQQQMKALNRQSVQLFRDYYGLLASPRPDSAQANRLSQQIADNQQAVARLNFAHFSDIKALCRPDQQAYFTQLVDELARLFGRQQRPPRHGGEDGPPKRFMPGP